MLRVIEADNSLDVIGKYNDLFVKNQNLKYEVKNLQCRIQSLKEFKCFGEIKQHDDGDRSHLEEIGRLKCELDEKEEELTQVIQELAGKKDEYQMNLKCILENLCLHLERGNKNACSCKCNSNSESKLEPISVSNPSSSKEKSSSECTTGSDCEHIDDDMEKLISAIDIYRNSNCACDPYRSMFEKSRITICGLMSEKITQTPSSKKYDDMALSLKVENLTMAKEMSILVMKLEELISDKEVLETKIIGISHELYAKIEIENNLSKELKSSKEELLNMKYALDMRIEEKSQIMRELDEKVQIIEESIKITEDLEKQLITNENKLRESETLKNVCYTKLDELTADNKKVESELEQIKADNIEKTNSIDNLQKEVLELKTVIKASDIQRKYHEEEIEKLKEGCSTVECKSGEAVNELNKIIETVRRELKFAKLELDDVLECLRKTNEEKESITNQKRALEHDIENLTEQLKEYKTQNDQLTKTNLINELEQKSLRDEINKLTCQLHEVTTENNELKNKKMQYINDINVHQSTIARLETINCELKDKLQCLEQKNCDLVANIDELNVSLVQANKLEICARKDLVQCNQSLKIANDEIENFDLEIKGVNKELNETREKLKCVEQKLKDAELKLFEETYLKEQINEAYCKLMNATECNCERQMKQSTKCYEPERESMCLKCTECQTDITAKQMSNEDLKYSNTQREYDRLVRENDTLCSITKDLKEDIQNLRHLNRVLKESIENQKTRPPEADKCECPDDRNPRHSNPSGVYLLRTATSACSCTSNACSCSGSKTALDKCRHVDDTESEKLRCQLNEMIALCDEKEKTAEKALRDAERRHCDVEMKLKQCLTQSQNQMGNLNGKLADCEMTVRCKERELNRCRLRECQLLQELEKLNVQMQCKDQKLESDKTKCASLCNTVQEYKKQLKSLSDALETEKSTKTDLDQQIRAYSEMCSIQSKQVTDLEKRLETTSQLPKASTGLLQRNIEKRVSPGKRSKACTVTKRSSKILGLKLPYISCCVGLAEPCNRLKMWEASQARMASSSRARKEANKRSAVQQPKKLVNVDSSTSVVIGSLRYERLMHGARSSGIGMRPESEKQSHSILKKTTNDTRRKQESKIDSQDQKP